MSSSATASARSWWDFSVLVIVSPSCGGPIWRSGECLAWFVKFRRGVRHKSQVTQRLGPGPVISRPRLTAAGCASESASTGELLDRLDCRQLSDGLVDLLLGGGEHGGASPRRGCDRGGAE